MRNGIIFGWGKVYLLQVDFFFENIQGEYYVPVRQTEAVVRLLMRLWLIFLLFVKILFISNRKNIFFAQFLHPGLQQDL